MEELVGRRVKIVYTHEKEELNLFEGKVLKIENNLVFLTNVKKLSFTGWADTVNQVVNTISSAFVRFEII